ncbi:MAG: matrixin family metalloprotease [Flavisolibacter sp.]
MKSFVLLLILMASTVCKSQERNPCVESNRWKFEDYTQKPLFVNQVFAKGFAVHFIFETKKSLAGPVGDSVKRSILNAFRVALTNWGVSLILNEDSLPDYLKNYINDFSFKKDGISTYNAPMVFEVACPENANFIIRIYYVKSGTFPDANNVLAKAQIKGRTILMNFKDHHLQFDQRLFDLKDAYQRINLVPVLAHELGHCFGLTHVNNDGLSIMANALPKLSRFPTKSDGKLLANILTEHIMGTSPGYFSPNECQGLYTK